MMVKTFKEYVNNQQAMRERLYACLKKKPMSFRALAREIGISPVTVIKFLKEEKNMDFIILTKIEKWIKDRECE